MLRKLVDVAAEMADRAQEAREVLHLRGRMPPRTRAGATGAALAHIGAEIKPVFFGTVHDGGILGFGAADADKARARVLGARASSPRCRSRFGRGLFHRRTSARVGAGRREPSLKGDATGGNAPLAKRVVKRKARRVFRLTTHGLPEHEPAASSPLNRFRTRVKITRFPHHQPAGSM